MEIYVVYEGHRTSTRRAAEAIAEAAAARGVATIVRSTDRAEMDHLSRLPALVAGCTVRVDTPFGGEPVSEMVDWIEDLPDLNGLPVGVFCTYKFFPHTFADTTARVSEALSLMSQALELRGAKVQASQPFHVGDFEENAEALVADMVESVVG